MAIYLMKQEARTGTYFKVGYTTNLSRRTIPYITHNANAQLIEFMETYEKTKKNLECKIHKELTDMGYEFIERCVMGIEATTEWFFVPIEQEQEFEQAGLSQFKSCKNRKVYKVTH